MTSFEVIDSLLRSRPSPRMGVRENVWPQTLEKWIGQGYPTDADGKPVDTAEHFDHDWANVGGGFDNMPIRGFSEVIEETDEWKIVRNGAGAAHKRWKVRAGTPEHVDFTMRSREAWEEKYRGHLLELDPERLRIDATREALDLRRQQKRFALFGSAFVFETMRSSLGDLCMYESFAADPAWLHDYCRVYTDFYIRHFRATIEQAGRPDGMRVCEDLGYKNGLFCSPRSLQELIFPYYKELVAFFHSYDVPVILHSCGGVTEAVEMVVEAGFDGLDPMERAAGCDPVHFAERTGNQIALIGGFDKRILESGDRDAIRQGVVELTAAMRHNGVRYVFSTDHSISTNVDYEDYQYMLAVFRNNMAY